MTNIVLLGLTIGILALGMLVTLAMMAVYFYVHDAYVMIRRYFHEKDDK